MIAAMTLVREITRSDQLVELRESLLGLCRDVRSSKLGFALQLRFIFDSSIVVGEIRFSVVTQKNLDARSALIEVIESETIEAFAPLELIEEVERRLPSVAEKEHVPLELLVAEWERWRSRLQFVDVASMTSDTPLRDQNDYPFLKAHDKLGTDAILTADKDILAALPDAMPQKIVFDLRRYAREQAIVLSYLNGAMFGAVLNLSTLRLAWTGLKAAWRIFSRLPPFVQVLALALGGAFLLSKRGQTWLRSALEKGRLVGRVIFDALEACAFDAGEAMDASSLAWERV